MKITIKRLTPKHYDDIIKVWQEAKLPYVPKGRDSRKKLTKQMRIDPDLFFGAFFGKELVGVTFGSYDGRRGTINRLAIKPAYRRKGIAAMLVCRCERALRARGATVVSTLIELPNKGSVGLFKKAGFVVHERVIYLSKRNDQKC